MSLLEKARKDPCKKIYRKIMAYGEFSNCAENPVRELLNNLVVTYDAAENTIERSHQEPVFLRENNFVCKTP